MISTGNVLSFALTLAAIIFVFSQTTEPPDTEDVPEICKLLIETDNKLVEKYAAKPKGDGEGIMALARTYNDALAVLVKRAMKEKTNNRTATTIAESKTLIDHGGPQFINFYVEKNVLEERFGLNNVSSRILCCQRQNAIDLWQDFYGLYELIPDEDDMSV